MFEINIDKLKPARVLCNKSAEPCWRRKKKIHKDLTRKKGWEPRVHFKPSGEKRVVLYQPFFFFFPFAIYAYVLITFIYLKLRFWNTTVICVIVAIFGFGTKVLRDLSRPNDTRLRRINRGIIVSGDARISEGRRRTDGGVLFLFPKYINVPHTDFA